MQTRCMFPFARCSRNTARLFPGMITCFIMQTTRAVVTVDRVLYASRSEDALLK